MQAGSDVSFWGRIKRTVRRVITRARKPEPPEFDYGGTGGSPIERDEPSVLPDGWVLVGLYHQGEQTERLFATDDTEVTDNEIGNADALIVWYRDAGSDGYRWIHGADDWDSLSDQISRVIVIVSPTGRGE